MAWELQAAGGRNVRRVSCGSVRGSDGGRPWPFGGTCGGLVRVGPWLTYKSVTVNTTVSTRPRPPCD